MGMGPVTGYAIYRDSVGITHVACCYRDGPMNVSRRSFLRCDAARSGGAFEPGEIDALVSFPTCLRCASHPLP